MAKLLSNTRVYGTATIDARLFVNGNLSSHSTNTGALQVFGGVGVSGGGFFGGTVTATNFIGSISGTAGSANNITGGTAGQLLYQVAASQTGFVGPGTAGQILVSSGTNSPVYFTTSSIQVGFSANLLGGAANQFAYQTGPNATAFATTASMYVGNSVTATNIRGGNAGEFIYQSNSGVTAFATTGSMYVGRAVLADSVVGGSGFINTVQQTASAAYYLTFVDSNNGVATAESVYTTSSFVVNPGTANVGLGTASPSDKLELSGIADAARIRLTNTTAARSSILGHGASGFYWQPTNNGDIFELRNASGTGLAALVPNTTNFGIGTTGPSEKLHVAGSTGDTRIRISADDGTNFRGFEVRAGSTFKGGMFYRTTEGNVMQVWGPNGSLASMYIDSNNSVRINSSSSVNNTATGSLQLIGGLGVGGGGFFGGVVTATTFVGNLTGSVSQVNTQQATADAIHFITFVDSNNLSSAGEFFYTTSSLAVNPGSGNVGINQTTPRAKLDVTLPATNYGVDNLVLGSGTIAYPSSQYSGQGGITFKGPTADARLLIQDGNGRINWYWNAYADTGGYKYQVSSEPAARFLMSVNGTTGAYYGFYSAAAGTAGAALAWTQIAELAGASNIWFSPRGTNSDFYINSSGNVGIGTTSPGNLLHLYQASDPYIRVQGGGNYSYIRLDDGSTNGYLIKNVSAGTGNGALAGALYTYTDNNKAFQHIHSGTPLFTILSTGNTGIGSTAPDFRTAIQTDVTMSGDINPGTAQLSLQGNSDNRKRMILGYDTNGNGFGFIKAGFYGVQWTNLSLQPNGGNVGIGTTGPSFKLDVSGTGNASSDWRAPIFYDSNDTTYYTDPASTSIVNILISGTATPTGSVIGGIRAYGSSSAYMGASDAAGRTAFFGVDASGYAMFGALTGHDTVLRASNTEYLRVHTGGYTTIQGSTRSPIFYDSANTAYYFDLNNGGFNFVGGSSNRVTFYTNDSGYHLSNSEGTGATVRLGAAWGQPGSYSGTSYTVGSESTIKFWIQGGEEGYIDSSSNFFMYGSARAPIFYDYNDTGYYVDPASTSNLRKTNFYVQADTACSFTNDNLGATYFTDRGGRYLTSNGSNWLADGRDVPLIISGSWSHTNRGLLGIALHNEDSTNGTYSPSIIFGTKSNSGGYNSAYAFIMGKKTSANAGVDTNWNSGELHFYAVGTGYIADTPSMRLWNHGDMETINSVRSPIFYDYNNTGYYVDPDNTSNVYRMQTRRLAANPDGNTNDTTVGTIGLWTNPESTTSTMMFKRTDQTYGTHGGVTDTYATYWIMDTTNRGWIFRNASTGQNIFSISNNNGTTTLGTSFSAALAQLNVSQGQGAATTYRDIDLKGSWAGGEGHAITATHASGGSNIVGQLVFEHNSPGSRIKFGRLYHSGDQSTYPMNLISNDSSGNARLEMNAGSDMRSPIYYDTNDTGYYTDPNGYSRFSYGNFSNAPSGRSLSLGTDDNSRVYNDANRSSLVINALYYPHLYINSTTDAGNTTHGAVFSMTGILTAGGYRRWGMGIANRNPGELSFGWYDNDPNPHYGVGINWSYPASMWIDTGHHLYSRGSMRSPIFYDYNDTGYYVDPASYSNLNRTSTWLAPKDQSTDWAAAFRNTPVSSYAFHADISAGGPAGTWWFYESMRHSNSSNYWGTQIAWGWEDNANRLCQRNITGNSFSGWVYYLNNGVTGPGTYTAGGDFRAPIFYDSNNTGYYADPASVSRMSGIGVGESYYTHGYPGVLQLGSTSYNYNFSNGSWASSITAGILANCADEWEIAIHDSGTRVVSPLLFQGAGTNRFLMGRDIGWGTTYVEASQSFRAPIFYDSNDTGYYCDPNGTSVFSQLFLYGNRSVIRGGSPTLYFRDTDEMSAMIHCNSNLLYILRGGVDSESWSTVNGYWPQYWNLSSNYILMGGVTETVSDFRAPIFYDSNNTAYYFDGNSETRMYRTRIGPYAGSTSNGNQTGLEIINTSGTGDGNVAAISFHCGGYYGMHQHLRHDGYFGIGGWSASAWRWYVYMPNGDMTSAGSVTATAFYYSSDRKLKKNIESVNVNESLDIIKALNPVHFTWKDSEKFDTGFIAQEVQSVLPEAVEENVKLNGKNPENDETYLTLKTSAIIAHLTKVVQTQQKLIENLSDKLDENNRRISILEKLLEKS